MLRCYLIELANIFDLFAYGFPSLGKRIADCSGGSAVIAARLQKAKADGLLEG